ncbi:hypothetical protein N7535_002087 [Penicillium sp. DV-2018c]|nr:hypothetical protein N7535_002087 [Penicillium sp. DV-2018c]
MEPPMKPRLQPIQQSILEPVTELSLGSLMNSHMEFDMEPPMAPLLGPLPDPDLESPMTPLIGPLVDLDTDASSSASHVTYLPDSMGLFFRLPAEVRLMIWEYLFSTIHTRLPNGKKPNTNPLSILCTSHYLYTEISSHLYADCIENIFMKPTYDKDEWMCIQLESTNMHVEIILKDKASAVKHFQTFPHHRANVVIHLEPPMQDDPGQLVLLWKKSLAMVDIIIDHMSQQQVTLVSTAGWEASEPPLHWQSTREDFFELGGLQETLISEYSYFPDHDIILLPFMNPRLWLEDPADMAELPDEEFVEHRDDLKCLFCPTGLERRMAGLFTFTKETGAAVIEGAILETNIFLENSLDELPGLTASYLRLDRFKDWFEDGYSWKSAYQVEYSEQLSTSPWVAWRSDPLLRKSNMRYVTLILFNHLLHCLEYGFSAEEGFGMFMEWNSCMWSDMFRLGLPPLSVLRNAVSRQWSAEEQWWIFENYAAGIARVRVEKYGSCQSEGEYILRRLGLWNNQWL